MPAAISLLLFSFLPFLLPADILYPASTAQNFHVHLKNSLCHTQMYSLHPSGVSAWLYLVAKQPVPFWQFGELFPQYQLIWMMSHEVSQVFSFAIFIFTRTRYHCPLHQTIQHIHQLSLLFRHSIQLPRRKRCLKPSAQFLGLSERLFHY